MKSASSFSQKNIKCLADLGQSFHSLEVMIPDIHGYFRGKVLRIDPHKNLEQYSLLFPYTALASDYTGDPVMDTGLVWDTGDPDYPCTLEIQSLCPTPWEKSRAQVIMQIRNPAGGTVDFDGREILRKLCARYAQNGLTLTAAIELEFTLLPEDSIAEMPRMFFSGNHDTRPRLYDVSASNEKQAIFDAIQEAAGIQNLPTDSLVKEAAPGQYEINLHHVNDALLAADHGALLKHLIRCVARKHHHRASFMAKPFAGYPGNGLHIHLSIQDQDGRNIFSPESPDALGSDALYHALAGIQRTTSANQLIFQPNINSFKRIAPNNYAPCSTHWGFNNRNVALRIPAGDHAARRIEHRLAGADANPYLVMAALLMGIDEGLRHPAMPSQETTGNLTTGEGDFLPQDPGQAYKNFVGEPLISEYFSAEFQRVYAICHKHEISRFHDQIMPIEYDWYFDNA